MAFETVTIGPCTLYRADCLDVLPTLRGVDAVVTDPPYGMNLNVDTSRFSGGSEASRRRRGFGRADRMPVRNDDKPFDPLPWIKFPKCVLWGCNHYAASLPVGTTLVWIKRLDGAFGSFLSDAELAWVKGGHGVYCQRDTSNYAATATWAHPCQKPVGIMEWCIEKASVEGETVLDPFMGSGTTGVACVNLGRRFIGIEIDERYFQIAVKRITRAWQDKCSELPFTKPPVEVQRPLFEVQP